MLFKRAFWQIYLACFVMGIIAMVVGGGSDTGPISFGKYGEIDSGGGEITLLSLVVGPAIVAGVCCWLFPD